MCIYLTTHHRLCNHSTQTLRSVCARARGRGWGQGRRCAPAPASASAHHANGVVSILDECVVCILRRCASAPPTPQEAEADAGAAAAAAAAWGDWVCRRALDLWGTRRYRTRERWEAERVEDAEVEGDGWVVVRRVEGKGKGCVQVPRV